MNGWFSSWINKGPTFTFFKNMHYLLNEICDFLGFTTRLWMSLMNIYQEHISTQFKLYTKYFT